METAPFCLSTTRNTRTAKSTMKQQQRRYVKTTTTTAPVHQPFPNSRTTTPNPYLSWFHSNSCVQAFIILFPLSSSHLFDFPSPSLVFLVCDSVAPCCFDALLRRPADDVKGPSTLVVTSIPPLYTPRLISTVVVLMFEPLIFQFHSSMRTCVCLVSLLTFQLGFQNKQFVIISGAL